LAIAQRWTDRTLVVSAILGALLSSSIVMLIYTCRHTLTCNILYFLAAAKPKMQRLALDDKSKFLMADSCIAFPPSIFFSLFSRNHGTILPHSLSLL
jgi:hypothetical protein